MSKDFEADLREAGAVRYITPQEARRNALEVLDQSEKSRLQELQGPDLYTEQEQRIANLEAENKRLRTALKKYAEPSNWRQHRFTGRENLPWDWWVIVGNGYDLAREALKEDLAE